MRDFWIFFATQFVSYFLLTWNYRAVAFGLYLSTIFSDLVIGATNYFVIKRVAEHRSSKTGWAGYTLGGVAGSSLGIFLTRLFYGR